MKKQLIAMAVAAAFAGPVVAQTTISATVDFGIDLGSENAGNTFASDTVSTTELRINSVEDLGGGLKAFVDIHTGFGRAINGAADADITVTTVSVNAPATITSVGDFAVTAVQNAPIEFGDRGGRIGLSGPFGTVAFGRTTGTAFNSMRGGVAGNLSNLSAGALGARVNNAIDYTAPAFAGTVLRGIVDTENSGYEISVVTNLVGVSVQGAVARDDDETDYVVRLGYRVGDVGLNGVYQSITNAQDKDAHYSLGATYTMGAVQLVAEGQRRGPDTTRTNLGGIYNLSKRSNAYIMMTNEAEVGQDAVARVFLGMRHTF